MPGEIGNRWQEARIWGAGHGTEAPRATENVPVASDRRERARGQQAGRDPTGKKGPATTSDTDELQPLFPSHVHRPRWPYSISRQGSAGQVPALYSGDLEAIDPWTLGVEARPLAKGLSRHLGQD